MWKDRSSRCLGAGLSAGTSLPLVVVRWGGNGGGQAAFSSFDYSGERRERNPECDRQCTLRGNRLWFSITKGVCRTGNIYQFQVSDFIFYSSADGRSWLLSWIRTAVSQWTTGFM